MEQTYVELIVSAIEVTNCTFRATVVYVDETTTFEITKNDRNEEILKRLLKLDKIEKIDKPISVTGVLNPWKGNSLTDMTGFMIDGVFYPIYRTITF